MNKLMKKAVICIIITSTLSVLFLFLTDSDDKSKTIKKLNNIINADPGIGRIFPNLNKKCKHLLMIREQGNALWEICRDLTEGITLDSPWAGDCVGFTISSHGNKNRDAVLINHLVFIFNRCVFNHIEVDDTLEEFIRRINISDIQLLKLDIDKQSWSLLEKLISSGILHRVKQLLLRIEFSPKDHLPVEFQDEETEKRLKQLPKLHDFGFSLTFSEFVPEHSKTIQKYTTCCYYSTWVKFLQGNETFRPEKLRWLPDVHTFHDGHTEKLKKPVLIEPKANKTVEHKRREFYTQDVEAERLLASFNKKHINCPKSERMGNAEDGGWDICLDPSLGLNSSHCLVYSIGIGGDFSFDEDMADYGCDVFAFDPSMNLGSHKHSERVWFFDFGLLDVNSNGYYGTGMKANTNSIWKVRTLEGLMAEMNHQHKVIDVLKIDIEGAEWSSLHNMLEEGILHYVKQLVVEVHLWKLEYRNEEADIRKRYSIIKSLEKQGFKLWHYHMNAYSVSVQLGDNYFKHEPCCFELGWINTQYHEWKS